MSWSRVEAGEVRKCVGERRMKMVGAEALVGQWLFDKAWREGRWSRTGSRKGLESCWDVLVVYGQGLFKSANRSRSSMQANASGLGNFFGGGGRAFVGSCNRRGG